MNVTIGVLGAARTVKSALLDPAWEVGGVTVTAVAARAPERARAFADEHGIPRVLGSYDDVLNDPDISAVYVPTPAALHGRWTRRAIAAGKHVLCEKPFAANAGEAAEIAEVARADDLVVMEAFHSRHHPMWARMAAILRSGTIGPVRTARAAFTVPHPDPSDIRWQRELGGGALMDLGVYPVHLLRFLFGEPQVEEARARDVDGVDASMTAALAFPGAVTGEVVAGMREEDGYAAELEVTGAAGSLHVRMPYHPYLYGLMTTTTAAGTVTEEGDRRTSYAFQLEAFRDAVRDGRPVVTDAREATATMRVIDAIYRAAGMSPRTPC
ncbi:Gfo/Idh/MocA family protein [Actinomadura sp. WMMB 499]|uniref:Gfo/Idh/MocA family protein n=1 Tax=Actinomadura sp. WMMB 499 TaxID=1219491 RepID=UPI001245DD66|nr:Gfo/Idh/MocA family oxidoreductase [Actinomadura sp. WMMB 499]QFG21305.1 Gfo/Idh/MocA family oxidoreductase [Actinomadura sp. WMMB 499]